MDRLNLKTTHKPVRNYYYELRQYQAIGVAHEGAVRAAFQNLLESCANAFGWKLVGEWPIKRADGRGLRVDGALVDEFRLTHGYWEAKDSQDDLTREIKKKLDLGYPQNNILFQSPDRAILWQDGRRIVDADITDPDSLVQVLKQFFEYAPPEYEEWDDAVAHFQNQVPELGRALAEIVRNEERSNIRFRSAFDDFLTLCRQSINPNISKEAVEEMLIQHLLTERIFRTVFNNPDFTRRNVIAVEIEKVIDELTSQAFSRDAFLQSLDRFYKAIDSAAKTIEDFSQKQLFLNTVYEKFFQGFSVKVADTHGIVYTPPPIVNFIVRSVEEILEQEFGKSLSSHNVHILDPFVGTGNFIVHIMQAIRTSDLAQKFRSELHCNEVMLLPYYIASMNIEHEFYVRTRRYESFEGICLVDTFELAEAKQASFFSTQNTERVEEQKRSPIFVIAGNPPYNQRQINENDNNKNRKYKVVDRWVAETYAKESRATNKNALSNPYVKAIRWASNRIGDEGIVAFVTGNSFIDEISFDGMRKHLEQTFDLIYVLDLGGDVRRNPKLSGTTHNVFGIQIGVSINIMLKRAKTTPTRTKRIYYAAVPEFWRKEQKYDYLDDKQKVSNIDWTEILPDKKHTWLTKGVDHGFDRFLQLGTKATKKSRNPNVETIFKLFSNGNDSGRDDWVYNFDREKVLRNASTFSQTYNSEVDRWLRSGRPENVDDFVLYDDKRIKWTRNAKRDLTMGRHAEFSPEKVIRALYRPFATQYLYSGRIFNKEVALFPKITPTPATEAENQIICAGNYGRKAFAALITNLNPNLNLFGDPHQAFPFFTYKEDGTEKRENITDWALERFRERYAYERLTKWQIFHYVYAVLHHPLYRERFAGNLKRELPRIPFAPDFRCFSEIGERLAEIHLNYEKQPEYALDRIEAPGVSLNWRVEKMKLNKDKRSLIYNEFLTLRGIPAEVFDYRLGNRSALEWIIDQYRVRTNKRSGITNDPNRTDDPEYIVRLIGQVITVSLETVELVKALGSKPLLASESYMGFIDQLIATETSSR